MSDAWNIFLWFKKQTNLHEAHKSTPNDSRLTELIQETLKALSGPTEEVNLSMANELTLLFATAQSADTRPKLEACLWYFFPNESFYFNQFNCPQLQEGI